jgi:hypothetical protein
VNKILILATLVKNLNVGVFTHNTNAIAHSVATYARSFDSLPPKNAERTVEKGAASARKFAGSKACGKLIVTKRDGWSDGARRENALSALVQTGI